MCRRAVNDDLGDVTRAVRWVDSLASEAALSDDVRYGLALCAEEALVNLILHGRPVDGGKDIAVAFHAAGRSARLVISDRCAPFDVTGAVVPPRPTRETGQAGGQGIRLLRAFSASVAYESAGGRNALTLEFKPGEPAAAEAPR